MSVPRLPQPEPMPSLWAYRLERWRALARSPRKLANYLRYLASSRRAARVSYLPIKLDIENVSRCNFHCTMCQVSDWPKSQRAADMPFEAFKHLIDHQYGLVEIKLQGMGEPLLGRETFFEMIRYARSKHIWVRTTTNASLLHLNDNYKTLIDSGVNEVQISIDGATPETFERIRRGSHFKQVMANCKLINDYCQRQGIAQTKMWTVVQRDNFHELLALLNLAHSLGFTSLVFSMNLTDWGQVQWHAANGAVTVVDRLTPALVDQLLRRARELGVRLGFWDIASRFRTTSPHTLCPWPFERAYVSSDLKVVPCCMIANPDVATLGEAEDFTACWTSEAYQEFRQAHLDGRIPNVCQGCYKLTPPPVPAPMDGPVEAHVGS